MDDTTHELSAAYALDALEPEDARAFEEHLAHCERCQEEIASFSETARALAYTSQPLARPALRARILDVAQSERSNVRRLRPRWAYASAAVAAVAACAALGLGIWAASLHSRLDQSQQALRGLPLRGANGSLVVTGDGRAALVISSLPAAPSGRTYEAWVIRGKAASPAGIFQGGRTVTLRLTQKVPHGAIVGVTTERAGGVQQPTRAPIVTSPPA
ncbi:MAG: anti-sigma factor [Gaiellaceae bacterium]